MFWWDELTDNWLIPSKHSLKNSGLDEGQISQFISSEPSSSTIVLIRLDPRGTWLWMKITSSGLRKSQSFANHPRGRGPLRPPWFGAAGEEPSPERASIRSSGLFWDQIPQIQSPGPSLREIIYIIDDLLSSRPWKTYRHRIWPQQRPELLFKSPGPVFQNASLIRPW